MYHLIIMDMAHPNTSSTDAVWEFFQIHFRSLTVWCLTGGQPPWFTQHFVQKW